MARFAYDDGLLPSGKGQAISQRLESIAFEGWSEGD
jgi:hypothetical protein